MAPEGNCHFDSSRVDKVLGKATFSRSPYFIKTRSWPSLVSLKFARGRDSRGRKSSRFTVERLLKHRKSRNVGDKRFIDVRRRATSRKLGDARFGNPSEPIPAAV